jgi:hypothetical protein
MDFSQTGIANILTVALAPVNEDIFSKQEAQQKNNNLHNSHKWQNPECGDVMIEIK